MGVHIRAQSYGEYLIGNSWRCSKSTTGAHHWIVGNQIVCKYCLLVKQIKLPDPLLWHRSHQIS